MTGHMLKRLALTLASVALFASTVAPAAARADFGIEAGSFTAGSFQTGGAGIFGAGAAPDTRAGGHPFQATTTFSLNTHLGPNGILPDGGAAKEVVVDLPPGFIGDPFATPRCVQAVLIQTGVCPIDTQVGVIHARITLNLGGGQSGSGGERHRYLPVYNMLPGYGEPALFAFFNPNPSLITFIHLGLDASRGYAVTATVPSLTGLGMPLSSELTLWGVPADPGHDQWRGYRSDGGLPGPSSGCLGAGTGTSYGKCPSGGELRSLLTDPAVCNGQPVDTRMAIDSWLRPGRLDADGAPVLADSAWSTAVAQAPPVTGCEKLRFGGPQAPVSLTFQPSSHAAETPTGYEARLNLPYNENTEGLLSYDDAAPLLANPTLRDTTVTLPEGVVVNPSSAHGLTACSTAQIGLTSAIGQTPIRFDAGPPSCPDGSKLGTVEVHSPLVDHVLHGSIYLAAQDDNPFESLLAIYIVVDDPETGIVVKLAGHVEPDPRTGRLTARFGENPQLPFTELDLRFFGGPHASLINPPTCGPHTTTTTLRPWSHPYTPDVTSTDSFSVNSGPNGAGCPAGSGGRPNAPSLEAGTLNPVAATYSPFVLHLERADGTQQIKGLNATLPPGLTGKLAGIPYCSDQALALAGTRAGRYEQSHPDCPAASQIGTVDVGAGAGPDPFHVRGSAYLAGPYKGAPLSLAIITPAVAGPFDLGTVVVRTALYVNPVTAQINAVSDPLPTILQGIPLDVRSITVKMDRPQFTLNPTNCREMQVGAESTSVFDQTAALSNRFQVAGCRGLAFKPRLALRVFGKTNRNAKPRFRAVVQARPGEANIGRAQVNLPHSEFLEQAHIKTICTRVQFAAGDGNGSACPQGSIYGWAKAWTPLLDRPLVGRVHLRSSDNELPDLVAALNGQVDITLVAKVDSGPNEGIRNTFELVPDAPVSKFMLVMKGGKKGLLVNSEDLCHKKAKTRAIVRFAGQNGAVRHWKPKVRNDCKKKQRKARRAHARGAVAKRSAMGSDDRPRTHDPEER